MPSLTHTLSFTSVLPATILWTAWSQYFLWSFWSWVLGSLWVTGCLNINFKLIILILYLLFWLMSIEIIDFSNKLYFKFSFTSHKHRNPKPSNLPVRRKAISPLKSFRKIINSVASVMYNELIYFFHQWLFFFLFFFLVEKMKKKGLKTQNLS